MNPKQHRSNQSALQRTMMTLLLVLGSAAPVAIAFFLVASTNHDGNPLDKIPDYESPITEMLTVPFDHAEPTYSEFQYRGRVRLVIEGTGQASGSAYSDAFYLYTDANGQPLESPQTQMFDLEIDGQRAISALRLESEPPLYNTDHLYTAIYNAGSRWRRIAFRVSDEVVADNTGAFTITLVQIE